MPQDQPPSPDNDSSPDLTPPSDSTSSPQAGLSHRQSSGLAAFWVELKRRKVMRVAISYAVVTWLLIQIAATVFPQLGMPDWTPKLVTLLLLIGFPIALIIAWAFELTPDGVKTTRPAQKQKEEVSTPSESTRERTVHSARSPLAVPALIIGAVLFTAITIGGFWMLSDREDSQPPTVQKGNIFVVIVIGENVDYAKTMHSSFLAKLSDSLEREGYSLSYKFEDPEFTRGTFASPRSEEGKEKWDALLEKMTIEYSNRRIDYFVTLGTYATHAIIDSGMIEKATSGLVYLGVTDPKKSGFVELPRVAGVQYGTGGRDYGEMIDALFNGNQKLVFLYNEGVAQDEFYSEELAKLNKEFARDDSLLRRQPRFTLDMKPVEEPISLDHIEVPQMDTPETSPIYFAWHDLDNILGDTASYQEIRSRPLWVVPSTYSSINLKTAGIVVSIDDAMVGELGANIILDKIKDPQMDLKQVEVKKPSFRTWISRDTIRLNRIDRTIKPDILIPANRKNYPWITFEDSR
jgi:hypothetical protein